jgi:hypothetical protein
MRRNSLSAQLSASLVGFEEYGLLSLVVAARAAVGTLK